MGYPDQSIDKEQLLKICTPKERGLDPSKLQMHEKDYLNKKEQG